MADIVADEWVSLGGWVFATPACRCTDLAGLWTAPEIRGDDRVVPGVAGETVRPRVLGATTFVLPVVVFGERDENGLLHSDVRAGLRANIDAMKTAVLPEGASPTVALVHRLPDGSERTGDAVVVDMQGPNPVGPAAVRFGLQVKLLVPLTFVAA